MREFQCDISNNSPTWNTWNVILWKLPDKLGGGFDYLARFKDAWVSNNKLTIKRAAHSQRMPALLLAGVCWNEVAGDPTFIDTPAHMIRSFDWSGPDIVDRNLTITKRPEKTSFGPVSMQIQVAAEVLGIDAESLNVIERQRLGQCLEVDVYNIDLAARHLRDLIDHDGLQLAPPSLSDLALKVAATRYNRGKAESLEVMETKLSYGEVILKRRTRINSLLNG